MRNRAFAGLSLVPMILAIALFLPFSLDSAAKSNTDSQKFRFGFLIGDGMTMSVNNAIRKLYQERPELKGKIEVEVLSRKLIS